ncbi:Scr1 family TA system antitoxin-like transcriptional regulator [Lentzea sp.]|uniref:Scr1 family TA system antitoxin-like transcriptional regulator n=1 Tax=Lentzea sp. TaxID=56099 RepID=UPI002C0F3B84|nr:Scr1 family TA system antitoxin-like transcriptional regulator [Lentzea sp.]HUQ59550.1 Scr1 family TA system antitoxin-like transcriptional regulator [Lentzea sp.]
MTQHGAGEQLVVLAAAGATRITCFSGVTIPVLLRTECYEKALAEALGFAPAPELQSDGVLPQCVFFIHEYALRTAVGNNRLMEDQVLHLLFHAPSIRVVPESAGGAAAVGLDYALIQYEHEPPLVYLANWMLASDLETVERAVAVFRRMHAVALDNERSRDLLMEYVAVYDR